MHLKRETLGLGRGSAASLTAGPRFPEECVSCLSLFVSGAATESSLFAASLFFPSQLLLVVLSQSARQSEGRSSGAAGPVNSTQNPQIFTQLAKVAHIPEPSTRMCVFRAKVKSGGPSWRVSRGSDTFSSFIGLFFDEDAQKHGRGGGFHFGAGHF